MQKTESDYLTDIQKAIETVMGPQTVAKETLLKRDLGIQSIDIVDIFFELEQLTGFDVFGNGAMLAAAGSETPLGDFQVDHILKQLMQISAGR